MWSAQQRRMLEAMGLTLQRLHRPDAGLPWIDAPLPAGLRAAVQRVAGPLAEKLSVPSGAQGAMLKRLLWRQLRDLRRGS